MEFICTHSPSLGPCAKSVSIASNAPQNTSKRWELAFLMESFVACEGKVLSHAAVSPFPWHHHTDRIDSGWGFVSLSCLKNLDGIST